MLQRRVIFLTAGLSAGGAEKNTVTIANELVKVCPVSVICLYPGGVNADLLDYRVELLRANKNRMIAGFGFILRTLKYHNPLCLICNKDDVSLLGYWAVKLLRLNTRVIARVANKPVYFYEKSSLRKSVYFRLLRQLYKNAFRVVSVSSSLAEELRHIYELDSEKVEVVYNPPGLVDQSSTPVLMANSSSSLKLVTIGRLVNQKNHSLFLSIVKKLSESRHVEGFIVGTGHLREELQRYANELGIQDKVHFVDYVDNPINYLKQADLFILSSHYEGLPGGLMHALVSGVKIVAVDCEHGASEILGGGEFGALVPDWQVQSFTDAIDQAAKQPQAYSPESLSKHMEQFDLKIISRQWCELAGITNSP